MKTFASVLFMLAVAAPGAWAQDKQPIRRGTAGTPAELIAVENEWSRAAVGRDAAALDRFYAADYIFTNEDGVASNKAKEITNITTGAFRLTSFSFSDMEVRVYGNVAVVTGANQVTGKWEDINKEISGPYRFTDVFVKRAGRWQCVASQSSRISAAPSSASSSAPSSVASQTQSPPAAEKKAMDCPACKEKKASPAAAASDPATHQHPDQK